MDRALPEDPPRARADVRRQLAADDGLTLVAEEEGRVLGLVEARLVDTKDHDYLLASGMRPAGVPVHDMWARVTIDRHWEIRAIEEGAGTRHERAVVTSEFFGPGLPRLRILGINGLRYLSTELCGVVQPLEVVERDHALPDADRQRLAARKLEVIRE